MLESSHATASQLRLELDALRSEVLTYEDACVQARLQVEQTRRERREVELSYAAVRDEFDMQLHKLMQARRDAEESEHDLRVRLSKSEAEHVDLSERLNQLRQLEDEFNKKEHIIDELVVLNKEHERKQQLWEALRGKKTTTSPSTSAASSPTSASTAALVGLLQSPLSATQGERAEPIPAELFDAVKGFAAHMAKTETAVAALEADNREQAVRLSEASRSIQSLILQLDRSTNVHADLNHAMRAMEAQYMDECVKVEHSLKTIHLLQKQKKDQQTLLIGYEERMKHFQQLLTAADVRADSANTFLSELLRGWNVLKYGNRQMNEVIRRMRAEYRRMRKERNDAYAELHEKLSKTRDSGANANSTPSSTGSSAVDPADFFQEKERKLDAAYRQVMDENTRLHVQVDEEKERADKLADAALSLVPKAKYDEELHALHFELDDMKRFVRAAEEKLKRVEDAAHQEKELRALAEAELARVKEEREKELKAAREAEEARAKAEDAKAKADSMQLEAASELKTPGDKADAVKREDTDDGKAGSDEERSSKKRKLDASEDDGGAVKEEATEEKTALVEAEKSEEDQQREAPGGDVEMQDGSREKKEEHADSPPAASAIPPLV